MFAFWFLQTSRMSMELLMPDLYSIVIHTNV